MRFAFALGAAAPALLTSFLAFAQTQPTPAPAPIADKQPRKVETLTVTASPLNSTETQMTQPATVLGEEDLRRRQAASIGDTVGRELGVQSSSFGPAAGRPIIRGLDGPRVRVMQNGTDTMDVSSISPDHMVATDALNATQVEILRGPASLLYGSGAIGGVVNVVNNAIPSQVPAAPTGAVDIRGGSANRERTASAELTAGTGPFALNLNGLTRQARDYRIPEGGRLANTAIDERGAGIGGAYVGARGYGGLAVSSLRNDYGIPSPEAPRIRMRQTRVDAAAEVGDPFANVTRLKFRAGYNDYEHQEIEPSGEVGTTFLNKAWDTRLELAHVPWKDGKGAVGVQFQDRIFSALGEEAIIPRTQARAAALFAVEQKTWGNWTVDAGVRIERESRDPEGGLPARRFSLGTASAGVLWKFAPGLSATLNLTHAERAPSIEELYSNGPHHATETFDVGDPQLKKERSRGVDLMLRGKAGPASWKVSLFASRVRDFVFLRSADLDGDGIADRVDHEGAPGVDGEFLYLQSTAAQARFRGAEAEWRYRPEGDGFGYRVFGDTVRGKLAGGEDLPRQSPSRFGAELDWRGGRWSAWVSALRIARQSHVAPLESATPGYTRFDAELAYVWEREPGRTLTAYLQGSNLGDRDIRVHTSYLKDFAPLMGRSFLAGLRGTF